MRPILTLAALVALMIAVAPAQAQKLAFSTVSTTACLQEAVGYAETRACVGLAAENCMTNTPGGQSTAGMNGCLDRELAFWDDMLNRVYGQLRDQERAAGGGLDISLRDMQRAWIAFRDARCGYEAAQWMGGTGQGPAALWCLMDATAEQAFYLESNLR